MHRAKYLWLALWLGACASRPKPGETSTTATTTNAEETSTKDSEQSSENGSQDGTGALPKLSKIHDVQGDGATAKERVVTVEAVVIGDYQRDDQLRGFFVQEEDQQADKRPETSEGIFVFCGSCETSVQLADRVQVRGQVGEHYGMSQIDATIQGAYVQVTQSQVPLPKPVELEFPIPTTKAKLKEVRQEVNRYLEAKEGMRVVIKPSMTVQDLYALGRYGQLSIIAGGRLRQPNDLNPPNAQAHQQQAIDLLRRSIIWDDDNNIQNTSTSQAKGDTAIFHPQPSGFSLDRIVSAGDVVHDLTGVLHWSFAGQKGTEAWRIRSFGEAPPDLETQDKRPTDPPVVPGELKVAALNVQNFFSTINDGKPICGPRNDLACRGANSNAERTRQGQKLAAAICAMQADILGLTELENNAEASAQALADAIGDQCSGYDYIDSGILGTDAIKVGIFYRPSSVRPLGSFHVLDSQSFTDPKDTGQSKNRPALAQAFTDLQSDQTLSVVVNHLKSKGSKCGEGDDDLRTGQGSCNQTRLMATRHQLDWLDSLPNSENLLLLGDFNAHRHEDPMQVFREADYVDTVEASDPDAHTYVFGGLMGSLDHALANKNLAPKIKAAKVWNINADESSLLDYNDDKQDAGEKKHERKSGVNPLFKNDPFRCADHNPIIIGLTL